MLSPIHAPSLPTFAPSRPYLTLSCPSAISGFDEPNSPCEEMSMEELTAIARKLCVGGKGYPTTGGDGPIVKDVTNALAWDTRAVLGPVQAVH